MPTIKRNAQTGQFVTRQSESGWTTAREKNTKVPKGKPSKISKEAVEVNAGRYSAALIRLANR